MRVTVPVIHQEGEIPPEFKHEDGDDYWCFLTNFEFRDSRTNLLKSPEFITEKGVSLILTGYLLTPEQYKSSPDRKGEYFVKIVNLVQWAFDHEDDTKGIWVESKRHWFKLVKPTREFKGIYDSFEKKSNIWLDLRPILTKWIKKFDKCSDEDVESVMNYLTMEYVMECLKVKGHTEDELIENAFFIYDKAVQDLDTFSFEDSSDNQLLRTPFMKELLELSSEKTKIVSTSQSSSKLKKSVQPVMVEDGFSSDEDVQVKIVVEDFSSSSESSDDEDDEYYAITIPSEQDDSEEEEDEDYEESLKKRKLPGAKRPSTEKKSPSTRRRQNKRPLVPKNKGSTTKASTPSEKNLETSREASQDEDDEEKPKRKRKKGEKPRKAIVYYYRDYTLPPGVPTMREFLDQEFTPRLITKLCTKYEPGLHISGCYNCHRKRIACLKERPICSHCLEDGLECEYPKQLKVTPCIPCQLKSQKVCNREKPCNHCEKDECYYYTTDNGLIIAQMKIAALNELYAKIDEEKENEKQDETPEEKKVETIDNDDMTQIDDEDVVVIEENSELENNRKQAAALKEEIEKYKKIAKEEKALTEAKKKELKEIFNFLN